MVYLYIKFNTYELYYMGKSLINSCKSIIQIKKIRCNKEYIQSPDSDLQSTFCKSLRIVMVAPNIVGIVISHLSPRKQVLHPK